MSQPLDKAYQPAAVQDQIAELWQQHSAFHAKPSDGGDPYCIVIPPPNVTAALHMGHALNNTLQDILIRWRRMVGDNTLWMPGTDHAGIATQTVVEKRVLKEEGKRRTDFQRDEFVAKIQAWKDEYEATITNQLKKMGCSCDWDRQRFTMDEVCAASVREAFFQLFKDGLIYRGKRLVNWDPVTLTALADDEVEMQEVDGHFYYLKYPLASEPGCPQPGFITVATTRPETMLGDTAVAINPKDPRAPGLRGKKVKLPIVNRVIPIIEDDYVVLPDPNSQDAKAKFATGFLKVTPAHDPNDYEIGRRHNLPVINVMAPDASISDKHGWTDIGDAQPLVGLAREAARKAVVDWFKKNNLLEEAKPYRHSVGHSYRSHVPIEPYLSDQWYVKVTDDRLAGAALAAMAEDQRTAGMSCSWKQGDPFEPSPSGRGQGEGSQGNPVQDAPAKHTATSGAPSPQPSPRGRGGQSGGLRFYPERYARTFQTWHENIRDWCISRQLWWGHRIPVWSYEVESLGNAAFGGKITDADLAALGVWQDFKDNHKDDASTQVFFEFDVLDGSAGNERQKLARQLRVNPNSIKLSQSDKHVFVCLRNDNPDSVAKLAKAGFKQDPDVLDTWFSSGLWPISTMGWPDPRKFPSQIPEGAAVLEKWNPGNLLCTAREIITLWVSRMVMFNIYFRGCLPFKDVFIHAMIQDGEGRKMSKSLGNGVDPLDIIHSHGADAMRFTLASMTTSTQDVRMPVEKDATTGRNTSPKFDLGRNFCNKLWNAARFVFSKIEEQKPTDSHPWVLGASDQWILSRLARTIHQADAALAGYEFNQYAQTIYNFFWRDYCDWYVELVKPVLTSGGEAAAASRTVLAACLDAVLRLLHPVAPFVTERLWMELNRISPQRRIAGLKLPPSELCIKARWPQADAKLIDEAAERKFELVQQVTGAIRNIRNEYNLPPKQSVQAAIKAPAHLAPIIEAGRGLIASLAVVEIASIGPAARSGADAAVAVLGEIEVFLEGLIDRGAEKQRLTKRLEELTKSVGALKGRLNNPGYIAKAPPALVEESKAKLAETEKEIETITAKLKQL